MEEASHFAAVIVKERHLLEAADADHLPVKPHLVGGGELLIDGVGGVFRQGV